MTTSRPRRSRARSSTGIARRSTNAGSSLISRSLVTGKSVRTVAQENRGAEEECLGLADTFAENLREDRFDRLAANTRADKTFEILRIGIRIIHGDDQALPSIVHGSRKLTQMAVTERQGGRSGYCFGFHVAGDEAERFEVSREAFEQGSTRRDALRKPRIVILEIFVVQPLLQRRHRSPSRQEHRLPRVSIRHQPQRVGVFDHGTYGRHAITRGKARFPDGGGTASCLIEHAFRVPTTHISGIC